MRANRHEEQIDFDLRPPSSSKYTHSCKTHMTEPEEKKETTDRPSYSLQVKADFVLSERCSSLPPIQAEDLAQAQEEQDRSKNKKWNRGMNKKKRPRDAKVDNATKVCLAIMKGETCQYGDKCRFSHDMKEFLATRPDDIAEIGVCPNFEKYGECGFGVMCRAGSCHLNLATGENIKATDGKDEPVKPMNLLSKEVQDQLRKRKYPFVCKRRDDKFNQKKNEAKEKSEDAAAAASPSPEPLPTKERKLIDFSNKIYVAPLTTVGNLPFRRIMKGMGADITCGEMALCQGLLEGKSSEWSLVKRHPSEDIFGVQIAAGYPDMFTRTCELVESHMAVDFVDLNLGCPLDLVCDKGSGAKLMLREKNLRDSLHGISSTLSCPVTIKMRTGWDMSHPIAHKLVSKIQTWSQDLPPSSIGAVMIHGRSRLQRYSREADWDYIRQVANCQDPELPKIPVVSFSSSAALS